MKYLDMHVHCDSTDKDQLDILAKTARDGETILALSGGLRYGGHDFAPNETVIEICKRYPDCFIPLAKLDLWETADPNEVYRYAEMGVKGFKCIYPYYEYDHDIYMPVYEAAEKCGLPLLFHTGNYRPSASDVVYKRPVLKNMNPINLDRIARSFQKLHIIMAHLGTRIFQDEASQYIKMHANLYADLGGCGQWKRIQPKELYDMLSPELTVAEPTMANFRKLVLGSDAYVTYPHIVTEGHKHYVALLERIGVPAEIIAEVMGKTVASWLGIQLEA
ncbi:MAG: amidohydrolase family protein [Lentisphaeria bacterium]|nr:amidohydrolase family protein [Lentisphaeria bacterium]